MSVPPPEPPQAYAAPAITQELANLGQIRQQRFLPGEVGQFANWPDWVPPVDQQHLHANGIAAPWQHQVLAWEALWAGQDIAVTTGTGSGKSLIYQLPAALATRGQVPPWAPPLPRHAPHRTALYLAPTKALAQDQLHSWQRWPDVPIASVTGDTSPTARQWAKQHAHVLCSTPDFLHHVLLPQHAQWRSWWRRLAYIVIDECHVYRGVFGGHVAGVLRRALRIAEHHGADVRCISLSATIGNPGQHAQALTGRDARVVDVSTSARAPRQVVFWEAQPDPTTDVTGSVADETAWLTAAITSQGYQTLTFVNSRAGAERIASLTNARRDAMEAAENAVMVYRGGLLPEERRDIELRLRRGDLRGVISTSALELGVDLQGLDVVIVQGWPGTRAALWQRWGRAGRGDTMGTGILIARADPLDQFLMNHPEHLFDAPAERVACNPDNPQVLAGHVLCAAHEVPLTDADFARFGPISADLVKHLETQGLLRHRSDGWYWPKADRPHEATHLRGHSELQIMEQGTGRLLGTANADGADATLHHGAVYVHQGQEYVVDDLNTDAGCVVVHEESPTYSTWPITEQHIDIVRTDDQRTVGALTLCRGAVAIRRRVTGYRQRDRATNRWLGTHQLDSPERVFTTQAVWWVIPVPVAAQVGVDVAELPGGLHALEHTAIGLLGLQVMCDRWDVGGFSMADHPQLDAAGIFVYDAYAGGSGVSFEAYSIAEQWFTTVSDTLRTCPCDYGCPACIQSPKCGNGNEPLSKSAAAKLAGLLLP